MKILLHNQSGSVNSLKKNAPKMSTSIQKHPQMNDVAKNTMQELLGRSQVSFRGDIISDGPEIVYTQKRTMGIGQDERITYDKVTGTFRYVERYPNGSLKKLHEFDYFSKKELVKEFEKDGSGYVELTNDTEVDTTEFMEGGKPISRKIERVDGSRTIFEYEYKQDRIIVRDFAPNSNTPITNVLDIKSQMVLDVNDPRTITRGKFKKPDGAIEKRRYNLISGYVYDSKIFKDNRLLMGYSRDGQGNVTWDAQTDRYGILHENYYDSFANITKTVVTDFENRSERIQEFDSMGLASHILNEYDKHNKPRKVTIYDTNTNNPSIVTTYNKSEIVSEEFNPYSQVRTRQTVTKNSKPVSSTVFHADGQTPKIEDLYFTNGIKGCPKCTRQHSEYDKFGREILVEFYSNEGCFESHFYNERQHFLECVRRYNLATGRSEEDIYDINNVIIKTIKRNSNGKINKETNYYYNTNIPSLDILYSPDGAVTKTYYSEQGTKKSTEYSSATGDYVVKEEYFPSGAAVRFRKTFFPDGSAESIEFDINGNIIDTIRTKPTNSYSNSQRNRSSYSQYRNRTYEYETQSSFKKEPTSEEVIDNISSKIFRKGFSTTEVPFEQWEIFAKLLGLESPQELLKMEHKTYKKLVKKFHPDVVDSDDKNQNEKIMKIINVLFEYYGTKGSK
ncbi:J domain-containing protein [bacterium]|nr:J domain-containing protein [bacterium]